MVAAALDALIGGEPADEAVEAALATIPTGELDGALRWLARQHGVAALPILIRCLSGRPERAVAAAQALATLPVPEAAEALEAAEAGAATKTMRTAARRALYRLRQAGIDRRVPTLPAATPRVALGEAWVSAIDGTGGRGLWLTLAGPYGERTLLAAVLSDETGLVDFSAGAIAKKRSRSGFAPCVPRVPFPGWRCPRAGPGPPSWRRRTEGARPARPSPRSSPGGSSDWAPRRPSRPRSTRDCPRPRPRIRRSSSAPRHCSPCPSWQAGSWILRACPVSPWSGSRRARAGSS